MTDKELIKREIERRVIILQNMDATPEVMKRVFAYKSILQFIDSIPEEHNEDLEESASLYCHNLKNTGNGLYGYHITDAFKAGAEWQKRQTKEALQTEYEKGRFDMREEMMKMAGDTAGLSLSWGVDSKAKIIIIEEGQQ